MAPLLPLLQNLPDPPAGSTVVTSTGAAGFTGAFILDISTLAGSIVNYIETPFQEVGQTVQVEWVQAGASQDIRLHGYAVRGVPAEVMETDIPAPITGSTGALSIYGVGAYGSGAYGRGAGTARFFILDVSTLGGNPAQSSVHIPFQERGRTVQVEWSQSGGNQDMRVHGYAIRGVPGEVMSMEPANG